MERHQKRGIGSIITGVTTALAFLVGSTLVSPYAILGSIAGLPLVAIGVMQFRGPNRVADPESASAVQRLAILALAAVSFLVGMAVFWYL